MENIEKYRTIFFYKDYFNDFYQNQRTKVKNKILWTLKVIETLPIVPEIYKALKIKSEYEQDRQ